jgi:phosphate transport system permease protein
MIQQMNQTMTRDVAQPETTTPSIINVNRLKWRKLTNNIMTALFFLATLISVSILAVIVYDIVREGLGAIDWNFLTRARRYIPADGSRIDPQASGIAHAIQGTLIITGTASLIAVPLGLLIAVYLNEFGKGIFAEIVRFVIDLMLQMPSIVIGIFSWAIFVRAWGWGYSGRAGAMALALIMTPIVVRSVQEVLRLVPMHLREAGWALGVPRWRVVLQVVVPTVAPGVVTGIVLAFARAAGESAPVLLTALGAQALNSDLTRPMHTIPLLIYDYTAQPYGLESKAWGAALILIVIVAFVNATLRMSIGRKKFEN